MKMAIQVGFRCFSVWGKHRLSSAALCVRKLATALPEREADLVRIDREKKAVEVCTGSGDRLTLPWIWLRDHCRSPASYNHRTFQRKQDLLAIPLHIEPTNARVEDDKLLVQWEDGHESQSTMEWLAKNSPGKGRTLRAAVYEKRVPWSQGQQLQELPWARVPFSRLIHPQTQMESAKEMLESLWVYGVAAAMDVPPTLEETRKAIEAVVPIMNTTFGDIYAFEANLERADTAYTNEFIGPHHDNTYWTQASGLEIFHGQFHNGSGGETMLVDGLAVANHMRDMHPEAYHILSSIPLPAEFREEEGGQKKNHFTNLDLTFKHDPVTGHLMQFRYNPYDRAEMSTLPVEKVYEVYSAYQTLGRTILEPSRTFQLKLRPGMTMFIDNFRVLHARRAFDGHILETVQVHSQYSLPEIQHKHLEQDME
ncbi:unnamed protein product [Darwinula stevensoni]|uniref:Trimethyllysine dioxygenase, mitochondrial n=1 Tax=Darwinula stevensoni TaxID=69355 RepID=A0A7R9A0Q1_9CRUS|nr:unnamed protein product [Darwinula stevensoni]CAG0886040.1 unnamed protein product [Darwinula stevensoni]